MESGQAVSIINAANNYLINIISGGVPTVANGSMGQGGHSKLLQPSPSSRGMRSHAEQRAGIALHAAHDTLQEDMRGFHSRATIKENEHGTAVLAGVVSQQSHPTQSAPDP